MSQIARRLIRRGLVLVLIALLTTLCAAAVAQSSQQIQQVMNMSPAERQQLMRQFGITEQDAMQMLSQQQGIDRGMQQQPGGQPGRQRDMGQPPLDRPFGMDGTPHGFDLFGEPFGALPQPPPLTESPEEEMDLTGRVDYSKRYGLDMFSSDFRGFQELYSVPVPEDYVIGPGDTFLVSLFGTEVAQYRLSVQRDGWIDFPALGPIGVAGLTFGDARTLISERITREKLGARSSITLDQLKSIQVSVSGEVRQPGVYVVPSLVSVIQLLNLAGGASEVGALRNVRLLRAGGRENIDLYDFLITGERSDVIGLQPGDRLHVPAVGAAVQVKGAVRRPGVYEMLPGNTLADLLAMAGGPSAHAALEDSVVRRYRSGGRQEIIDLDLRQRETRAQSLEDGMILRVPRASDFMDGMIEMKGEVTVPGARQWRSGLRLSNVFRDLRSDVNIGRADLDHGYIVRTDPETRALNFLSFSLRSVYREPGSEHDLPLQQEDAILVLPQPGLMEVVENGVLEEGEEPEEFSPRERLLEPDGSVWRQSISQEEFSPRERLLEPYLTRLARQTRDGSAVPVFTVAGEVHAPGTYPMSQRLSMREALQASGGLLESADLNSAVVLRRTTQTGALEVFTINLDEVRNGDAEMNLRPGDMVTVRRDTALANRIEVEVSGEVVSPGTYTLPAGSNLSDLIELAGGVNRRADLRSAIFSRARLREMEQELRTRYVAEIRKSLIDANVAGDTRAQANPAVLNLVDQLAEAISDETDGRLQIDLPRLASGDNSANVQLSDGDRLRIPSQTNAISVAGQVRAPGSFTFVEGMSVAQYLELAGGFAQYSDEDAIFILRADGSVQPVELRRSIFAFRRVDDGLLPGDRIVVPIEYGFINRWELAKEVVQFVYQTGIGLAAVVAALR